MIMDVDIGIPGAAMAALLPLSPLAEEDFLAADEV